MLATLLESKERAPLRCPVVVADVVCVGAIVVVAVVAVTAEGSIACSCSRKLFITLLEQSILLAFRSVLISRFRVYVKTIAQGLPSRENTPS